MQKASMVLEEERKTRKGGGEGQGSNIRIHETVLFGWLQTKDANPLLPVRSLGIKRSTADARGGWGMNEGRF